MMKTYRFSLHSRDEMAGRRQTGAAFFVRYVSFKRDTEKCLPAVAEQGGLLLFKDHFTLEFLGLENEHSNKELRKAILGNQKGFFPEFGLKLWRWQVKWGRSTCERKTAGLNARNQASPRLQFGVQ